jgi:hypothetical protein
VSVNLRQGTAKVIRFGPFLSPSDGVTPVTGLISKLDDADGSPTGIWLSKNGATSIVRNATITATTYDRNGYYFVTLDTTDTGAVGTLHVEYSEPATTTPVWREYNVMAQQAYDSLYGTDTLDVNVSAMNSGVIADATFASDVDDAGGVIHNACDNALKTENLDQLVKSAVAATFAGTVAGNSVIGHIAQASGQSFDRSTDSLQAQYDGLGDSGDIAAAILSNPDNLLSTDSSGKVSLTSTESTITSMSELAQGQPTSTPTMKQALMLIYMALRNIATNNGTYQTISNDAGTVISKCSVNEVGGLFTRGKLVTGP